jgi:hypothetical protein
MPGREGVAQRILVKDLVQISLSNVDGEMGADGMGNGEAQRAKGSEGESKQGTSMK